MRPSPLNDRPEGIRGGVSTGGPPATGRAPLRWSALLAALVLLVAACSAGSSEPPGGADAGSAEAGTSTPQPDVGQLTSEVSTLKSELDDTKRALATAQAELLEANSSADSLEQKKSELESQLREFRTRAYSAETQLSALKTQIEELRQRYDPEIRATAQAEVDAEIARACQAATDDIDADIEDIVRMDSSWTIVTTREDLVAAVTDCAQPERSRTAEQREAERLAACEKVSPDALEKNPADYENKCVHLYAYIVQYDSNTGPCSFHAEISDRRSRRWYDYDIRSAFGYEDSSVLSALRTDCPELDGIDGDDFVEVWATGLGAFTYDTAMGGSNTVPSFRIEKIELVAKN